MKQTSKKTVKNLTAFFIKILFNSKYYFLAGGGGAGGFCGGGLGGAGGLGGGGGRLGFLLKFSSPSEAKSLGIRKVSGI